MFWCYFRFGDLNLGRGLFVGLGFFDDLLDAFDLFNLGFNFFDLDLFALERFGGFEFLGHLSRFQGFFDLEFLGFIGDLVFDLDFLFRCLGLVRCFLLGLELGDFGFDAFFMHVFVADDGYRRDDWCFGLVFFVRIDAGHDK